MPIINFVSEKKQVQVPDGANLREEALKAGIQLYNGINGYGAGLNSVLNCHGLGMCGTCAVRILKGQDNASPMGVWERLKFRGLPTPDPMLATINALHFIGNEETLRLACLTKVHGDMDVETCPEFNACGENFFS